MISPEDLKTCPNLEILNSDGGRFVFAVVVEKQVVGTFDKKQIRIEVRCKFMPDRLILQDATVQVMDSDDPTPPEEWRPQNLERTLGNLIQFYRQINQLRDLEKQKPQVRQLNLDPTKSILDAAAETFARDCREAGREPVSALPIFVQMAAELLLKNTSNA